MKTKEEIVNLIYEELDSVYCYNCAFAFEISEEEVIEKLGYCGCDDCYRKYMGWRISKATAEKIANKIVEN